MIRMLKLVLVAAAIVAAGVASPVSAKSRNNGRHAFAMVPPEAAAIAPANDPAYTGGGSRGYNENLLKNQW